MLQLHSNANLEVFIQADRKPSEDRMPVAEVGLLSRDVLATALQESGEDEDQSEQV